jgi:membrane fusion protein, multidrug efflux system
MTDLRSSRRASLPFFAVALVIPFALSGCKQKQERQARPVPTVAVVPARRASVPYVIEANGIVTPLQSASVVPQVDGIIQSVDFEEGQEVRQGQPLFHIDPRPYQNAYDQAVAVLARDSATWVTAKVNADRYRQLMASKVVTPQEGEVQLTSAATAQATLAADRAAVSQARFNLENTVIRAPISGKTGGLLVRRGNLVHSGGTTSLVLINQVRPILVRFAIPSAQLPVVLQYGARGGLPVTAVPGGVAAATPSIDSLAAAAMAEPVDGAGDAAASVGGGRGGQAGRGGRGGRGSRVARASAMTAGAAVQQGGPAGDRMMGKLSFIDNAVDTATGTVQLKATFDNSNGRLWSGQFATTSLHLYDQDSALVVPQQAIVTGQRGSYVYIVDRADTARQRAVIVERNAGGLAIISNGLKDGDRVVVDGQSRLTPDTPVRLRGAGDNAGGGARKGGRRGGRGGG